MSWDDYRQTCNFAERIKMDSLEALTCSWTYHFFKFCGLGNQSVCWIRCYVFACTFDLEPAPLMKGIITSSTVESLEAWTWSWTSFHQEMVKNLVLQFCLHFWFRTSSFQKGMIASSMAQIASKLYFIQSLNPTRGGPCSCLIYSRILLL